jgi:hypothetical protein
MIRGQIAGLWARLDAPGAAPVHHRDVCVRAQRADGAEDAGRASADCSATTAARPHEAQRQLSGHHGARLAAELERVPQTAGLPKLRQWAEEPPMACGRWSSAMPSAKKKRHCVTDNCTLPIMLMERGLAVVNALPPLPARAPVPMGRPPRAFASPRRAPRLRAIVLRRDRGGLGRTALRRPM